MATEVKMEDSPLRPTGNMEQFNIIRNHVKFYNSVQVTATYSIPRSLVRRFGSSCSGVEGLVYVALKETLNHHPILGVTIHDEGTKAPRWVRLDTIDLRQVVEVISADPNASPDKYIQDGHRVPLVVSEDLPLWRIRVSFQDSALAGDGPDGNGDGSHVSFGVGLFAHHGIADGLSCNAFHLTFLDALNTLISDSPEPPSNLDELAVLSVPKLPLVPNLEMKATLSVSILFVLTALFKTYIYNPIDTLSWTGPPISAETPPSPPLCNHLSFALQPSHVSRIIAKCRAEKTTVTALLTTLVARKLALLYPAHRRFTANIPFSLRRFTGHSERDMGCYISNVSPNFSSEDKPPRGYMSYVSVVKGNVSSSESEDKQLWETARECKRFIDVETSTTHNQTVNLLKFVSDLREYFLGLLGKRREHAFEVTNLGLVDGGVGDDGDGEEKASFDRVLFSGSLCPHSDPYVVSVASVRGGFMTVVLSWEVGVVVDEEARDLLGWLEGQLRDLAER